MKEKRPSEKHKKNYDKEKATQKNVVNTFLQKHTKLKAKQKRHGMLFKKGEKEQQNTYSKNDR